MQWKDFISDSLKELQHLYSKNEASLIIQLWLEKRAPSNSLRSLMYSEKTIESPILDQLKRDKELLLQATPIQYVLQESWFYKFPFFVNSSVLIPRPETEELVELALHYIDQIPQKNPMILDVGTGSGCIAISIKKERPHTHIIGIDFSKEAIVIAKKNARNLSVNVDFLLLDILYSSSFFETRTIDLIVSNPPYIPFHEKDTMHPNVLLHEPHEALFVPSNDALLFYNSIGNLAMQKKCGICCEISEHLGMQTRNLFLQKGFSEVSLLQDLQHKDRMIKATP